MNLQNINETTSPEIMELMRRLDKGNKRYKSGKSHRHDFAEQRKSSIDGQNPYAVILTCSDSRVVPEYIFDEKIGGLFTIRNAGNLIDDVVIGSMEYAIKILGSKVLLILGHEYCGAVKAALDGADDTPFIERTLEYIKHTACKAKKLNLNETDTHFQAVILNVKEQMRLAIKKSDTVRKLHEKGELLIVGGMYDMDTGDVEFI